MILRLFAKIHARSRRRFFRFTPWQRLVFIVAIFALVLGGGELALARHVAKHMPWFDPQHRVYLLWRDNDSFREHISVAAAALSHVSDIETTEWEMALDTLMQSKASHYGLVIPAAEGASPILFAVQPTQATGVMPESWTERHVSNTQIVSMSRGRLSEPARFVWPWWKALKLRALWTQFQAAAHMQASDVPTFYGAVEVLDVGWNVFASPSSGPIRHGQVQDAIQMDVPTITSSVNTTLFPGIASLSPIWQDLAQIPVEFRLQSGQWSDLVDPFTTQAVWHMRAKIPSKQAQTWLQSILDTLMLTFPLAEQRVLPDRGVVYELKRKADFFLPANTTLDVETYPSGSFTYPRGQITYSYTDGVLMAQNGIDENTQFQPACQILDPLVSFSSSGQAMGIAMWRSLFLGLDKKKITLCLRW